jgi:hypothetical protein
MYRLTTELGTHGDHSKLLCVRRCLLYLLSIFFHMTECGVLDWRSPWGRQHQETRKHQIHSLSELTATTDVLDSTHNTTVQYMCTYICSPSGKSVLTTAQHNVSLYTMDSRDIAYTVNMPTSERQT